MSQLCSDTAGKARERMHAEMRVVGAPRYGFVRFWAASPAELIVHGFPPVPPDAGFYYFHAFRGVVHHLEDVGVFAVYEMRREVALPILH